MKKMEQSIFILNLIFACMLFHMNHCPIKLELSSIAKTSVRDEQQNWLHVFVKRFYQDIKMAQLDIIFLSSKEWKVLSSFM